MSENVIFCFSGSGNCLDMAKNIARVLGDSDIVMMRRKPSVTDVRKAKRVGFVFPCYGGGLPEGVEDSVRSIQINAETYRFAVCMCSAYPGIGLSRIHEIVRLDYWQVVTHLCSCIWLFPYTLMLPPMSPAGAQNRSEREAKRIGRAVKALAFSKKAPRANPLNALENRLWKKISAQKAKKFDVSSMCIGCGSCAGLCPKGNIQMVQGKPQFGTDCLQCLSCLQYCPQEAISLGSITKHRKHYHNPNVPLIDLTQTVIHIG